MHERRKVPRSRTYLGGHIAFNDRYSVCDCLVRDLSPNGARVVVSHPMPIPSEFDLTVLQRGDSRRARLIWGRGLECGVEFLAARDSAVTSIETAREIRRLQAERETLARRVAELSEPT
jgi:hypothetical protein